MYDQVAKYYRYDVYTTISNHVTNENIFPAITICDLELLNKAYFTYCGHNPWSFEPDHPLLDKPCNYSSLIPPSSPDVRTY